MFDVAGAGVTEHLKNDNLKTLQIKCHVGLGDGIVLQGMVHYFLMTGKYRKIVINTRKAYVHDISRLYGHVSQLVELQPHESYDEPPPDYPDVQETIKLGFFSGDTTFHVPAWDREFYRQAGVPFVNRWLHCHIPAHDITPLKRRDYTIRHHDPKRGYLIEGMKPDMDILATPEKPFIFDWLPELMSAREIHVIDSCVMNLVESMWHNNLIRPDAKLCYHAYARKDPPATVLAPWKVIK